MNTYSPERKAALIARMMPPHNQPVVQLARSEGIPANTLYAWRSQAGVRVAESQSPGEWSQDARFAVLPPCQDSCRLELKNFRGPETTKMNTYSPERKAALIARMMPPHNQSVVQLA
ncbi:transposase, partial [Serratia ficaria]